MDGIFPEMRNRERLEEYGYDDVDEDEEYDFEGFNYDANGVGGFEVNDEDDPDTLVCGNTCPMVNITEDVMQLLIYLSNYALNKHNEGKKKKVRDWNLLRLIKANRQVVAGFRYYITLKAKDVNEEDEPNPKEYHLCVVLDIERKIHIDIFRLKPSLPDHMDID